MIFPDLTLARRLELHEAWSSIEHARIQAQLYSETGASILPLSSGGAVFCGRKSPLSQVYGWGLHGPVSAADMDSIESFYARRDQRVRVCACPFADPSLFYLLGERRYSVQDFMNVYVRAAEVPDEAPVAPDYSIRIATPVEA